MDKKIKIKEVMNFIRNEKRRIAIWRRIKEEEEFNQRLATEFHAI